MLALKPRSPSQQTWTPNLLPCTIQHNGPIDVSRQHWDPQPLAEPTPNPSSQAPSEASRDPSVPTTKVSYLRGRKLLGRTLALPEGYEGVVLQKTDEVVVPEANVETGARSSGAGRKPSRLRGGYEDDEGEDRRMDEDDDDDDDDDEADLPDQKVEITYMRRLAGFGEVVVWGHERVPDGEDAWVKGVEEWVRFAGAVSRSPFHMTS